MTKKIGYVVFPMCFMLSSCASVKMLSDTRKVELETEYNNSQESKNNKERIGFVGVDLEETMEKAVKVATSDHKNTSPRRLEKYLQKSERNIDEEVITVNNENSINDKEEKSEANSEEVKVADKNIDEEIQNSTESDDTNVETDLNSSPDFNLKYSKKLYKFWISYFTKRDKERFIRHLKNGEKYQKLVRQIFNEEGLPEDLFYVGLIESGYNSRIRSRAKATGYWQFMKGTARNYGLKVNNAVDERTNIHKSTRAAAQYFKDLYNIFGSWELALCAYNAGEYRIIGAIRRGNTRDFEELVKKRLLPKETNYYIPKVMAARHLHDNLKILNLKTLPKHPDSRMFEEARVYKISGRTTLSRLAKDLNIPYSIVKNLNHDFRYKNLKGTRRNPLKIVLPKKYNGVVTEVSNITSSRYVSSDDKDETKRRNRIYRVRRGDNLTLIARRFGVSLKDLKYLNSLNRKGKILIGQRIKIPRPEGKFYIVRRGDNLSTIARKFNTSISSLLTANGLKSGKIFPRQKLLIPTNDKDS